MITAPINTMQFSCTFRKVERTFYHAVSSRTDVSCSVCFLKSAECLINQNSHSRKKYFDGLLNILDHRI